MIRFSYVLAWDLGLVPKLVDFEPNFKSISMYLGTQTEFFVTIFFKVIVNHLIRMLVKFLMRSTRGDSRSRSEKNAFFSYTIHVGTPTLSDFFVKV